MILKQVIATIFILTSMTSRVQKKIDLSSFQFHENAELLLKVISDVIKGEMFIGAHMISYSVTNKIFADAKY